MRLILALILISASLCFAVSSEASIFKKSKVKDKEQYEFLKFKEEKLDRRILLVEIYAKWCPLCKNIQPTLDLLLKENEDIRLIKLDVSTLEKAKESEKIAKNLRIDSFFEIYKSRTSTVGVFVPSTREIIAKFHNENDIEKYDTAIKEAKTKDKALETI